jgi:ATP-dependent Clp protease ATP-binding subunit ClpA
MRTDLVDRFSRKTSIDMGDYSEAVLTMFVPRWQDVKSDMLQALESRTDNLERAYEATTGNIVKFIEDLYPEVGIVSVLMEIDSEILEESMSDYLRSLYDAAKSDVEEEERAKPMMGRLVPGSKRAAKDLSKLRSMLKEQVINQETAVDAVVDSLKLMAAGLAEHSSLFFIGPTGNGKTRLAEKLADGYFGENFLKINCGEYGSAHEYAKLIGSPPGYIGHQEKSYLQEKAEISNSWVFLFDEIEKAHHKFYDFLLNLLDKGSVTDSNGNLLDFSRSLFIFTSNKGMTDCKIGQQRVGFGKEVVSYEESKDQIQDSLKTQFSPEFLNRIDKIIHFNRLSKEDLMKVAKLELDFLPVKKTKELINYIIQEGYSEEYGGRYLSKFIKNNIAILVADAVLEGVTPARGNLYTCKVRKGKPYIREMENQNESKTKADAQGKAQGSV